MFPVVHTQAFQIGEEPVYLEEIRSSLCKLSSATQKHYRAIIKYNNPQVFPQFAYHDEN